MHNVGAYNTITWLVARMVSHDLLWWCHKIHVTCILLSMGIETEDWGVSKREHLRVTRLFHLKNHHLEIKKQRSSPQGRTSHVHEISWSKGACQGVVSRSWHDPLSGNQQMPSPFAPLYGWTKSNFLGLFTKSGKDQRECEIGNSPTTVKFFSLP